LVVNWITVGLIGLMTLYIMFFASVLEEIAGAGSILAPFIIGLLVVGGLYILMTVKLANFSNTARIINIILAVLGLLSMEPFTIIINVLVIYALGFDKRTVELFQHQQPQHYGY